jgi:hypothetical protein
MSGESKIMISVEEPRPLLDEGNHLATCIDATCAWSRRWKKWIVVLKMEPLDYHGRSYSGTLCKFLALGTNPKRPHAGQQSQFRALWVEVNGAQPTGSDVDLGIFVGHTFKVSIQTVRQDRNGKKISPAQWYSIVREISFCTEARTLEHANLRTREHSNTATLQHANTATPQPSNPLTLTNPATPQHNNTPVPKAAKKLPQDSSSSLGSTQQTHNAHPETNGTGFTTVEPVPRSQDRARRPSPLNGHGEARASA